jgi:hypothetical protein
MLAGELFACGAKCTGFRSVGHFAGRPAGTPLRPGMTLACFRTIVLSATAKGTSISVIPAEDATASFTYHEVILAELSNA